MVNAEKWGAKMKLGWVWWRHQRAPLLSLASGPPNPKPTTADNRGCYKYNLSLFPVSA